MCGVWPGGQRLCVLECVCVGVAREACVHLCGVCVCVGAQSTWAASGRLAGMVGWGTSYTGNTEIETKQL